MADRLPKVLCTSVIRSSHVGDSHGGIYLVDLETGTHEQKLDWNDGSIDWAGRGGDRGLRGIAFDGDDIYIAASDEIFVFDRAFKIVRSIRNRYLKHCHEIQIADGKLYLTATAYDSILVYDLAARRFVAGYCIRNPVPDDAMPATLKFGAFDPEESKGPVPGDTLHINSVSVANGIINLCGVRLSQLITIGPKGPGVYATLPAWTHNARPFRGGVLANVSAFDCIGWLDSGGVLLRRFPIPRFPDHELVHGDVPGDHARQAFGRGLCVIESRSTNGAESGGLVIGGSSPASVTAYRLDSGELLKTVTLTRDVRNTVHGLEIWPFD